MKKTIIDNLDLELYSETLENKLEIYIVPMKNVNNIYVTFSTKYGSNDIEFIPINENKMKKFPLGIAHFLEHKMFEQKNGVDPFSFFSERGCSANANTNQTKTTYLFSGPNFLQENLEYLLDYVQSPYFTDSNVSKEKGIIEQEIKMYLDDPNTQLYEKLLSNCFVNHPIKYPIIGDISNINKITKEDLYECYNTFYNPSNMFIVITGNVEPNSAIETIRNNQSKKKFPIGQKIKIKKYDEPNNVVKTSETLKLNVGIKRCAVAYKIKLPKDDLYQALLYYTTLFDIKFGSTSVLGEKLKQEKIINSNLGIGFDNTSEHLLMFVIGETNEPGLLIERIKNELSNLEISKEDFERKKKTLISSLIYVSDNIFSINRTLMNDIIKYNFVRTNRYNEIKKLNFKDFNNLISKTDYSNISELIIEPKEQ